MNRMGVETGDVEVLIHARPMSGRRYALSSLDLLSLLIICSRLIINVYFLVRSVSLCCFSFFYYLISSL